MRNIARRVSTGWQSMLEKLQRGAGCHRDPGMTERSQVASARFFNSLRAAEEDFGAQYANEIAEAHVDAGSRFLDRGPADLSAESEYLATMPTASSVFPSI